MQDTLILGAASALRLANGDVVVASGKNSQLVWFDSTGRLIRAVGRRGRGPGEFGTAIHLYRVGDTIIAHDASNRRFHYVTADGVTLRTEARGDSRRSLWLYDRTLMEHVHSAVSFENLRSTLARIPRAEQDTLRLGRVTVDGHVWLRSHPTSTSHRIYAPSGALVAEIDLPERCEPYEIGGNVVLGRWLDEDDIEHIQLRSLTRPQAQTSTRASARGRPVYPQEEELAARSALIAAMRAAVRNLLTSNEVFYSAHARYPRSLAELGTRLLPIPAGVQVNFVWASGRSYAMVASHPSTPVICVAVLVVGFGGSGNDLCG